MLILCLCRDRARHKLPSVQIGHFSSLFIGNERKVCFWGPDFCTDV
jgi:hypothetical protein